MQLEIMQDFDRYTKGQIITTPAEKGVPCNIYWRRRLADAEIDGCVKIHKKARGKKK